MTATMTIALTVAMTLLEVVRTLPHPVPDRVRYRYGDRLRTLASFVLALAVVACGTVLYLELVAVLMASLE